MKSAQALPTEKKARHLVALGNVSDNDRWPRPPGGISSDAPAPDDGQFPGRVGYCARGRAHRQRGFAPTGGREAR